MPNREEIAKRIHATVWLDEELNVPELVDLVCVGLNEDIEQAEYELKLSQQKIENERGADYVCPLAEFERVRPSAFMKDPIGYMSNKLKGKK